MDAFSYKTIPADDAGEWLRLRIEGARDFPLGFLVTLEETAATTVERCREILNYGAIRGLYRDAKLVGFCGFRPQTLMRTRHRAEIGPFFVAQAHQGTGAADAMMSGVIEEARGLGLARLELYVDTQNLRAIAFYERHGFQCEARFHDAVRIDGVSRDDFFYVLSLT